MPVGHLTRKEMIKGAALVVAFPTVLISLGQDPAEAGFGDLIKGVGTALIQGVKFATQPLPELVQQGVNLVASVTNAIPPTVDALNGLVSTVTTFADDGLSQALPLFCNPGAQPVPINFFSNMSTQPLQLTSSDEQILRGDPYGYMRQNSDVVGGYVNRYGLNAGVHTVLVPGAIPTDMGSAPQYYPYNVPVIAQPETTGFFPANMSFGPNSNLGTLLTLFALLA